MLRYHDEHAFITRSTSRVALPFISLSEINSRGASIEGKGSGSRWFTVLSVFRKLVSMKALLTTQKVCTV